MYIYIPSSFTGDGSYYLYTGNSVDMGESFSGRSTPDSEAFREDGMSSAVSNYEHISDEVKSEMFCYTSIKISNHIFQYIFDFINHAHSLKIMQYHDQL